MPLISNRQSKTEKAFTLIELLVVIAIVGILAGLAVVSMSGATEAAKIAKSKVFANSVNNSLLSNRVSEWRFDEPSGGTTADSINSINGTLVNAPARLSSGCVADGCLQFNGSSSYVDCGYNQLFDITKNITISVWAKGTGTIVNKGGEPETYSVCIRSNKAVFYRELQDGTNEYLTGAMNVDITKWHNIVAVDDGSLMYIYVDGKRDPNTLSSVGWLAGIDSSPLRIGHVGASGSEAAAAGYFNGSIDEVRIYNKNMTAYQIREEYASKLVELLAQGKIAEEEYRQRIADLNSTYATNK
jgi:prepilin-type N-terminal cleavage/methylation domain-containing protein